MKKSLSVASFLCSYRRRGADFRIEVTHSAIVASADGERESNQFSPPFCSFLQFTEEEKTRDPDLSPTTTTFFLAERGGV